MKESGIRHRVVAMAKIAMLHTSFVFLEKEPALRRLIEQSFPGDKLVHFVDSDVLASVIRDGAISPESESRMVHLAKAAEAAGADVIFSACSSLGPAIDVAKAQVSVPVVKVDEAMTRKAAGAAGHIGVLATVSTTLGPTVNLIEDAASALERTVKIDKKVAEGAFEVMMGGHPGGHDEMVIKAAQELVAGGVELIVLAQASMSRLAPLIHDAVGIPVLSSPSLGVAHLGEVLAAAAKK